MSEWLFLILGAFLAYLVTAVYDRLITKPNIIIGVGENADGPKHRFIHLEVSNPERSGLGFLIRGNQVAEYVKVKISFIDPINNALICDYIARWSSKAEPLENINGNHGNFNPALAIEAEREILLPSETKKITLAVKHQGKKHFSAFNNWSYLYPEWENPEWCVEMQSVKVRVDVYTDKQKITKNFVIQNPSKNIQSFSISRPV